MSTLVVVLRTVSLLAFLAPGLLAERHRGRRTRARQYDGGRAPLAANLTAFGLFLSSLVGFPGGLQAPMALPLALSGCSIAVAATGLLLVSRAKLGAAWSLVPKADQGTGLITTGPYRFVRHPIYLGLTLLALGQALAFGSWPAVMVVLCGIVPTFVWRARAEEALLNLTFGERYEGYRQRTKMIIPYLL